MSVTTRKGFLAVAGTASLGALTGCGGEDEEQREQQARTAADLAIVRHLIYVERVATAFWDGAVEGGVLEGDDAELAGLLARNERTHAETLERYERRLGNGPSAAPTTNFGGTFSAGAREILRSGAALANLSAAAYLGQANRIQDRNILASVLAIHTVEGRQAAAIARAAGQDDESMPDGAFAQPMSMDEVRTGLRRYGA